MQTVTVAIQNSDALQVLQDLQAKRLISILSTPDFSSVVFPGQPLTEEAFKSLISEAEHAPNTNLQEMKTTWAKQRETLRKTIR